MKKIIITCLVVLTTVNTFANTKLKVAATPVPAAEILEFIKPDLKAEGIDLQVVNVNDYVTPNIMLAEKDVDANLFQHGPYLTNFIKEKNLKLTGLTPLYVAPLALYSKKFKTIAEIKVGATIAVPNDATNEARSLILLHNAGVIKLKDKNNLMATTRDIAENPKKLKFREIEAAQLPRILSDVDGAIINGNYAMDAGLVPTKDGIIVEDKNSPFGNILAVRTEDVNKEDIKKLQKALSSEKVKKFVEEKYKGGVVALF